MKKMFRSFAYLSKFVILSQPISLDQSTAEGEGQAVFAKEDLDIAPGIKRKMKKICLNSRTSSFLVIFREQRKGRTQPFV